MSSENWVDQSNIVSGFRNLVDLDKTAFVDLVEYWRGVVGIDRVLLIPDVLMLKSCPFGTLPPRF